MNTETKIPTSVTVICLGNICRSPVGEYLLRFYAKKSKNPEIKQITFDSSGLSGGYGGMYHHSENYLQELGINTRNFHSTSVSRSYLQKYDLIIVLEKYMKNEILDDYFPLESADRSQPELSYQNTNPFIVTLREAAGERGDISDPYGMSKGKYYRILDEIHRLCKKTVNLWESLLH